MAKLSDRPEFPADCGRRPGPTTQLLVLTLLKLPENHELPASVTVPPATLLFNSARFHILHIPLLSS